jgi:hypothetical protein
VLPKFAADLAWLKEQGVAVERYNLAQQPQVFVAHPDVMDALREGQEHVLPLVRLDGQIISKGAYPSREQLASWCKLAGLKPLQLSATTASACCDSSGCC